MRAGVDAVVLADIVNAVVLADIVDSAVLAVAVDAAVLTVAVVDAPVAVVPLFWLEPVLVQVLALSCALLSWFSILAVLLVAFVLFT